MQIIELRESNKLRDKLSLTETNKITKMYTDLATDTKKQIKALQIKPETPTSSLKKRQLKDLQKEIEKELEKIYKQTEKDIVTGVTLITSETTKEIINKTTFSFASKIKLASINSSIINNVVTGKIYNQTNYLSKAVWGSYQNNLNDINMIIGQGLAANKGIYEIAKDLEKYVDPKAKKIWAWSKVYPGSSKKIDYNAQRLARTTINHAHQQAIKETTKNNPFAEGVQWLSALAHGRTCQVCMDRHEKIYPIDKLPLDHPNGLCVYNIVLMDDKDIVDRLAQYAKTGVDKEIDNYIKYLNK